MTEPSSSRGDDAMRQDLQDDPELEALFAEGMKELVADRRFRLLRVTRFLYRHTFLSVVVLSWLAPSVHLFFPKNGLFVLAVVFVPALVLFLGLSYRVTEWVARKVLVDSLLAAASPSEGLGAEQLAASVSEAIREGDSPGALVCFDPRQEQWTALPMCPGCFQRAMVCGLSGRMKTLLDRATAASDESDDGIGDELGDDKSTLH